VNMIMFVQRTSLRTESMMHSLQSNSNLQLCLVTLLLVKFCLTLLIDCWFSFFSLCLFFFVLPLGEIKMYVYIIKSFHLHWSHKYCANANVWWILWYCSLQKYINTITFNRSDEASSSGIERAFSTAGLIPNDRRNRLTDVMFEQMLVAKHNGDLMWLLVRDMLQWTNFLLLGTGSLTGDWAVGYIIFLKWTAELRLCWDCGFFLILLSPELFSLR